MFALAVTLFVALPGVSFAQLDARALQRAQQNGERTNDLYGDNPFADPNGEGNEDRPAVSTK